MSDDDLAGHLPMVRRFLTFLTQDPAAAEEIAQETFRIAIEKVADRAAVGDCGAWLRGVAKNVARNHMRKKRGRWVIFDSGLVEMAEQRFVALAADQDTFWESRRRVLNSCMRMLPEEDRRLILRRYERRQMVHEIAAEIGVKPDTLSKRLERLRDALRKCVEEHLKGSADGTT